MKYRHQPILKVQIPKSGGGSRALGISTVEDKVVQGALKEVLEVVYEPVFKDSSYGYRPGRRAHDVLKKFNTEAYAGRVNWVLEADIKAFFDSIDRKMLQELIQKRVLDGKIRRLVGKCLKVGILEGTELSWTEKGTTQGSILSPLLANIYLHYVLDEWFEDVVKPRLTGRSCLFRFCDDFIIGFESKEDAERVLSVLGKRLGKFNLQLHPDKTKLVPFRRPPRNQKGGKGPGTFTFLGFNLFWKRGRKGNWRPAAETSKQSFRKAVVNIAEYCRRHRHLSVPEQSKGINRRVTGHFNYFAVSGNSKRLNSLLEVIKRSWFKWLCRRSQRARLTWERFDDLKKDFKFPHTRVRVPIWET